MLSAGSTPKIPGLTVEQAEAVVRLSCLPAFKDLIAKVQADEVSGLGRTPAGQLSQGGRRQGFMRRVEPRRSWCVVFSHPTSHASVPPSLPAEVGSAPRRRLHPCLHSSLASGWTAAPRSRRCRTSGVKRTLRVSLGQASPCPSLSGPERKIGLCCLDPAILLLPRNRSR